MYLYVKECNYSIVEEGSKAAYDSTSSPEDITRPGTIGYRNAVGVGNSAPLTVSLYFYFKYRVKNSLLYSIHSSLHSKEQHRVFFCAICLSALGDFKRRRLAFRHKKTLRSPTIFDCINNKKIKSACGLFGLTMSFSNLVSDIAFRDAQPDDRSSQISHVRSQATARSYTSTTATSVSISGDISSQLHAGYSHPLSRSWQAERQLTKVCATPYLSPS